MYADVPRGAYRLTGKLRGIHPRPKSPPQEASGSHGHRVAPDVAPLATSPALLPFQAPFVALLGNRANRRDERRRVP